MRIVCPGRHRADQAPPRRGRGPSRASYIWKSGPEALARVGDGEQIVPHRALLDAGVPFVLSTDNKPYQPLFAIWSALARTARESGEVIGPGQVITREERRSGR